MTPGGAWLQGHRQDLIVLLRLAGRRGWGGGGEEKSQSYEKKPRGRDGQTEPANRRAVSQAAGEGSSLKEPSASKAVHGVVGNEAPSEAGGLSQLTPWASGLPPPTSCWSHGPWGPIDVGSNQP